jgi:hypothetical protein
MSSREERDAIAAAGRATHLPVSHAVEEPALNAVVVNGKTYVPQEALAKAQHRLKLLSAATLSVLDTERLETGVDEWDEADQRCYLYNAASAIIERDANAAYVSAEAAERQIDDCLDQAQ